MGLLLELAVVWLGLGAGAGQSGQELGSDLPQSSLSLQPLSRSLGSLVSPPMFLRLAPAVVPGTGHPRREGPAHSWDHVRDGAGGGDPGGAPHSPIISSTVSDEVILSFVDSLTEVTFHLPFSLSLCLAFGQTTSNYTTRSNPYVCGMCGLSPALSPSRRRAQRALPEGPACLSSWSASPSLPTQGPMATSVPIAVLTSLFCSPAGPSGGRCLPSVCLCVQGSTEEVSAAFPYPARRLGRGDVPSDAWGQRFQDTEGQRRLEKI